LKITESEIHTMGPRNLLILFFSTVAVSLVILVIFFSLFFKNLDLNFNTKLPQSAPEVGDMYTKGSTMNPESKAGGLLRSTVNVPPEIHEEESPPVSHNGTNHHKPAAEPADSDLPPVSDDSMLNEENAPPLPSRTEDNAPPTPSHHGETHSAPPPPRSHVGAPPPPPPTERRWHPAAKPAEPPPPADDVHGGPPVPGQ
jgi:hypothetical protein